MKPTRRALLAGAAGALACRSRAPDETGLPEPSIPAGDFNVVLISSDQHGPGLFSHLGAADIHTPNLDRLAQDGVSARRCYTSSPVCAPTRQSLVTGLTPMEHGQLTNAHRFHQDHPTLPSRFAAAGFTTACFGKLHTRNDEESYRFGWQSLLNQQTGPAWLEARRRWIDPSIPDPERDLADDALFADIPKMTGRPLDDLGRVEDYVLVQEALAWLTEHRFDRHFLYLSLMAPHYPWDLPRDFYYAIRPDSVALPDMDPGQLGPINGWNSSLANNDWAALSVEQHRLCLARYKGAVAWMDHLIGQVLDRLDALKLTRKTLVVYSSDHGDMAGSKGLWLKSVMYDPAARKPLLVRMPGHIPKGWTTDALLGEVDLLPTLAGLVDVDLNADVRGEDYSQALRRPAHPELGAPVVFSAIPGPTWDEHPFMLMARGPRYKLTRFQGAVENDQPKAYELFDMDEDPQERENLNGKRSLRRDKEELEQAMDVLLQTLREPTFGVEEA